VNDILKNACPLLIIGGGNMGQALAKGWRKAGLRREDIIIVQRNPDKHAALAEDFTVIGHLDELTVAPAVSVLAMKPKSFREAGSGLKEWLAHTDTLLTSVMAGTPLAAIQKTAPKARVARVMPNTPSKVGEGMSIACAPALGQADADVISALFQCVGKVVWLEQEDEIHAATAIAGSGPAFVFAFMEAMQEAALSMGMDAQTADILVRQTFLGAATQASASTEAIADMRVAVTSPGGVTQAGLQTLQHPQTGIGPLAQATALASRARSREMAEE
jgi:pyrroline-5-carboxylate reductase